MALVNPNIALSYRPTTEYQPRNALAEYAQIQQIMGARTQQETAQMQQEALRVQMAKAQRDEQALDSWVQGIVEKGGPSDPMQATAEMIRTRNPQLMEAGLKMRQAFIDAQRDRELMGLPPLSYGAKATAPAAAPTFAPESMFPAPSAASTEAELQKGRIALTNKMAGLGYPVDQAAPPAAAAVAASANALAPAAAPAPTNALTVPTPTAAAPGTALAMSPEEQKARAMLLSTTPGVRKLGELELARLNAVHEVDGRLVTRGGQVLYEAPPKPTNIAVLEREIATLTQQGVPANDPRIVLRQSAIAQAAGQTDPLIREYEYAKRDGFKGSIFDYKRQLAQAGRSITAPPTPPLEKVIDPKTGQVVFVSRDEALRGRMTPAGQGTDLNPKQIQALEAKYPQATAAVKTFESNSDRLAKDLETLANHPGLTGISGLIYGRTPAITADARQAQALYDSIVARGGFKELQDMRAASPTGGALGNVSNQENQYLRDAFAPINRTQDTDDLKQSLLGAAQATRESKQRVREAYDTTYEYRSQRGGAAPAAAPAGGATGNWSVVR